MLAIMCEAFNLPFAPAREIFYHDPYFDVDKKRVLVNDGEVVSCLTIVESKMWIGNAPVSMAGIANVATLAAHRRQGFATELLKGTISSLKEREYGFSALLPYSYDFYRPLGWEIAGRQLRYSIPPACLLDYRDVRHVRSALPSDRPEIEQLYDESTKGRTGALLRDSRRWTYLLDHVRCKIVYKRQQVDGYALLEVDQEDPGKLRVLEIRTKSDAARRGIAGYLARRAGEVSSIEFTGSWRDMAESGLATLGVANSADSGQIQVQPGLMLRILNLTSALEELAPNFTGFKGRVSIISRDPLDSRSDFLPCTLIGDGNQVEVRSGSADAAPRAQVEGDSRVWAQVFSGYISLADALALNRLHAYSESAARLLAPLFPRRDPFLPAADQF